MATDRSPDARTVREFHRHSDVDGSPKALHHTLGSGPSQASPGNHTHDGGASAPIEGFSASDHNHDATYFKTDVPWITVASLLNSWVAYGAPFVTAQYRKVGDEIELRGLLKNGTVSTGTTGNMFVLPVGYRPPYQMIFLVPISSGAMRVDIFPDGSVRAMASYITGGTVAFLSLDALRFSVT